MELNNNLKNLQESRLNYEKKKSFHQFFSDLATVFKWTFGVLAFAAIFGLSFAGYPLIYLLATASFGSLSVYGLTKLSNHENSLAINYDQAIGKVHSEMGKVESQRGAVKRGPKVQLTLPSSRENIQSNGVEVVPAFNYDHLKINVVEDPSIEIGLDNPDYVQGSHR